MTVATFTQPDMTTQLGTEYKSNIDGGFAVLAEMGQDAAPHQAATPNLTVLVDPLKIIKADGTLVSQNQQTIAFTAPTTNPRISRLVIDMLTGVASAVHGAEAVSPTAPAIPAGSFPCAQVALSVGQTQITNANITDERTAFANYDARYDARYASLSGDNVFTGTNTFTNIGRILDRDVIQAEVVNTTVETTVYSFSIPGGTLGTNRAIRLQANGDYLNDSGAAQTLQVLVKFGGTTISNPGTISFNAAPSRRGVTVDLLLTAANATGAQVSRTLTMFGDLQSSNVAAPSASFVRLNANPTIAINTTVDQTLAIAVTHSAASANISYRQSFVVLELV